MIAITTTDNELGFVNEQQVRFVCEDKSAYGMKCTALFFGKDDRILVKESLPTVLSLMQSAGQNIAIERQKEESTESAVSLEPAESQEEVAAVNAEPVEG